MNKMLLITLMSFSLIGCSSIETQKTSIQYEESIVVHPPMPQAVKLTAIDVDVVTENNLTDFIEQNQKEYGYVMFLAISPEEYEIFARNMIDIRRYILDLKTLLKFYRD